MKKYIIILFAGLLTFASCMNDFDEEKVSTDKFTASNIGEPNATISEIRSAYSSVISNSTYEEVTEDKIIEGIVVANDITGNIYQFIYIQGVDSKGETLMTQGGIAVGVKGIGALYSVFPVGQKVRISLKGLYVGGYGASPRIGMPYINTNGAMRLGPMTYQMMQTHIQKIGEPDESKVKARTMTANEIQKNLDTYSPMLIKLENAEIMDAGMPFAHWGVGGDVYSEYHDIKVYNTTVKQLLYTSTSATFAGDTIPKLQDNEKMTIYGLLNKYSSSPQLSLRSMDDIIIEKK